MAPHTLRLIVAQVAATAARRSCRIVDFPALLLPTASASASHCCSNGIRPTAACRWPTRGYSTQNKNTSSSSSSSSSARRRAVTPFNDDGHVPWSNLSLGEKTGRAAQQTFNFGLVVVGVVLTSGVVYFLYTEVFSPDSKVSTFNRAVSRIRGDPQCTAVLGDGNAIAAFGQETWNKWQRARPIASTIQADAQGTEHIVMNFNVEGSRAKGVAYLHMVRPRGRDDYIYRYFYVDVPGHDRIYLERSQGEHAGDSKKSTLFGIKWS